MKERPILFSGPMVRALLVGTKTQTRRVVKPQPDEHGLNRHDDVWPKNWKWFDSSGLDHRCPYGQPGDRLYVRETWCCVHGIPDAGVTPHPDDFVRYRADDGPGEQVITDVKGWHPSIHMPRVYSRITMEIVSVRVERLNDISEEDAIAEGIGRYDNGTFGLDDPGACMGLTASIAYMRLWESINGSGSWAANPWVWCIEFNRVTP